MAALAKVLLFSAVAIASAKDKPPGFPCSGVKPTVLESKLNPPNGQASWPANCLGLTEQGTEKTTAAACGAKCAAHESCSVWQLTPEDYCYISTDYYQGTSCIKRQNAQDFSAKAGQRLQHGYVNVTQDFPDTAWYPGLEKVELSTGDLEIQQNRCRRQCFSDIYCSYWLYVSGTVPNGKAPGCYVETKQSTVGSVETLPTGQLSKGQMLSHTCTPPPTPKPEEESSVWPWILLAALLLLVLLAVLLFCLCSKPKEKKPKTTRAVKVAAKEKKPEVLMPLVPMPVVQQPMVAYAAPTVVTAPATATYQAVPQAVTYQAVPQVVPVVSSVAAVPMVATAPGGSVVMPAAGGSVVMPAAGGSVAMEQPRALQ